eukprot:jgi/Mesvir1/2582/Mv10326-RA.2
MPLIPAQFAHRLSPLLMACSFSPASLPRRACLGSCLGSPWLSHRLMAGTGSLRRATLASALKKSRRDSAPLQQNCAASSSTPGRVLAHRRAELTLFLGPQGGAPMLTIATSHCSDAGAMFYHLRRCLPSCVAGQLSPQHVIGAIQSAVQGVPPGPWRADPHTGPARGPLDTLGRRGRRSRVPGVLVTTWVGGGASLSAQTVQQGLSLDDPCPWICKQVTLKRDWSQAHAPMAAGGRWTCAQGASATSPVSCGWRPFLRGEVGLASPPDPDTRGQPRCADNGGGRDGHDARPSTREEGQGGTNEGPAGLRPRDGQGAGDRPHPADHDSGGDNKEDGEGDAGDAYQRGVAGSGGEGHGSGQRLDKRARLLQLGAGTGAELTTIIVTEEEIAAGELQQIMVWKMAICSRALATAAVVVVQAIHGLHGGGLLAAGQRGVEPGVMLADAPPRGQGVLFSISRSVPGSLPDGRQVLAFHRRKSADQLRALLAAICDELCGLWGPGQIFGITAMMRAGRVPAGGVSFFLGVHAASERVAEQAGELVLERLADVNNDTVVSVRVPPSPPLTEPSK